MRIHKGILIGLAGALIAGAFGAVAEAGLSGRDGGSSQLPTVTVPEGRVGDQFLYANFEHDGSGWKEVAPHGLRLDSVQTVPDRQGNGYAVVVVTRGLSYDDSWGSLDREGRTHGNHTWSSFVDLKSGELMGGSWDVSFTTDYRFGVQSVRDDHAMVTFGPEFPTTDVMGTHARLVDQDLISHGRAYTVGEDVTGEARDFLASEPIFYDGYLSLYTDWFYGNITGHEGSVNAQIVQAGTINDVPVIDQRIEGCVAFDRGPREFYEWHTDTMMFLSTVIPIPSRVCFTVDRWLSDQEVVPLLVQRRLVVNESRVLESVSSLVSTEHGQDTLPWGTGPANGLVPAPALERSPSSQTFPADGGRVRYAYRLADAIESVQRDPTLTQFAVWGLQNPGTMLIGAKLMPAGPDLADRTWTLIFGGAEGSAFVVRSQRVAATSTLNNVEYGEFPLPRFDPSAYAPGPLALSAGDVLYSRYVLNGMEGPEPNFALWGYRFQGDGINCQQVAGCGTVWAPGVWWSANMFGYVGTAPPVDRVRPQTEYNAFLPAPFDIIQYDADGNLYQAWHSHRQFEYRPLQPPAALSRPEVAAWSQVGATPGVDVARAALVSGSLLAIFMAVYFAPLLKWSAGNVVVAWPGFARLHRSALLDNKVRETMVNAIKSEPGITAPQLQNLTGAGWSTVVYHLGLLEKNKVVSSLIQGRHKHFFPADGINWSDRAKFAVLQNRRTRELFALIQRQPGVGSRELGRAVGIASPSVYWHMERLEKAGLVGHDRLRFRTAYYANPMENPRPREHSSMEVA